MFSYDELEREFERIAKKQKIHFIPVKPGHTEDEITAEDEITELEKDIGVKIADDYRGFLKVYKELEFYDIYVMHDLKIYAEHIMRIKESREEINAPIPDDMYVIGDFDPECPIFLQDTKGMSLGDSIRRGMAKSAADAAGVLLEKGIPALDLINEELIPALDFVGKGFEKGTIFLPQLLMSAEAAKAAFEVVKETMQDEKQETKGRIILATVKGDIHDIGKNIVKVMLENYSFEILDLGKDVAPETIVETAISENISLVGLSALMTTTVVSMEETIRLLREQKPDTKVVVGGAVMTQEYADSIGADCYAPDAMATVHFAEEVFAS